jgi:hypothetical protein
MSSRFLIAVIAEHIVLAIVFAINVFVPDRPEVRRDDTWLSLSASLTDHGGHSFA